MEEFLANHGQIQILSPTGRFGQHYMVCDRTGDCAVNPFPVTGGPMKYKEILKDLAPCGLSCRKCFASTKGDIAKHSQALKNLLGNFDVYAERFSAFLPAFRDYPAFRDLLAYLAQPDCEGCRKGTCKWPNCGVAACYSGKGVDFCFQCDEFPCDKNNFDPHLQKRWIQMQNRMKEIGVENYYEETKNSARYR